MTAIKSEYQMAISYVKNIDETIKDGVNKILITDPSESVDGKVNRLVVDGTTLRELGYALVDAKKTITNGLNKSFFGRFAVWWSERFGVLKTVDKELTLIEDALHKVKTMQSESKKIPLGIRINDIDSSIKSALEKLAPGCPPLIREQLFEILKTKVFSGEKTLDGQFENYSKLNERLENALKEGDEPVRAEDVDWGDSAAVKQFLSAFSSALFE
jgi:hypothetical protein